MGWVGFVGGRKAVEVSGFGGLEGEVTVGEFGEVGWGGRNRGRHVCCGGCDGWDVSKGSNSGNLGL